MDQQNACLLGFIEASLQFDQWGMKITDIISDLISNSYSAASTYIYIHTSSSHVQSYILL